MSYVLVLFFLYSFSIFTSQEGLDSTWETTPYTASFVKELLAENDSLNHNDDEIIVESLSRVNNLNDSLQSPLSDEVFINKICDLIAQTGKVLRKKPPVVCDVEIINLLTKTPTALS